MNERWDDNGVAYTVVIASGFGRLAIAPQARSLSRLPVTTIHLLNFPLASVPETTRLVFSYPPIVLAAQLFSPAAKCPHRWTATDSAQ